MALHSLGAAALLLAQPDLCRHWRTSVPRRPGVLYAPILAIKDSGTEYSLGLRPQFTLNTFYFFGFIYWSYLRCLFKISTVAFKKTVKSLCSTLRKKIFTFNLKVKLEGRLKALVFFKLKNKTQM